MNLQSLTGCLYTLQAEARGSLGWLSWRRSALDDSGYQVICQLRGWNNPLDMGFMIRFLGIDLEARVRYSRFLLQGQGQRLTAMT